MTQAYYDPDKTKGTRVWIPCKVSEGMFSNEYAVEIDTPAGESVSLFADKSLVRGCGDNAELLVSVVGNSVPGGERTVLLPNEPLHGSRWVRLPAPGEKGF